MPNESDKYAWCYVSGRVAAMEGDFLSSATLNNLTELYGSEALLRGIGETPYREFFHSTEDLHNAEAILMSLWQQHLKDLRAVCPSAEVPDLFVLDAEFQNYKSFLKARFFDLPQVRQPVGHYDEEDYERLLEGLATPLYDLFGPGTAQFRTEQEAGEATPTTVDWIFDAIYLARLLEAGEATGSNLVTGYSRGTAALKTAEIILRAQGDERQLQKLRDLFLPNLPDELAELADRIIDAPQETQLDPLRKILSEQQVRALGHAARNQTRPEALAYTVRQIAFDLTVPARMVTFGPERVFAFLIELQNELSNLKAVIYGKLAFMDSAAIRSRLVESVSIPT